MIAIANSPASDTPAVKPTVLVIDDELQIRRLLRVSLDANGYRVLEAATGQEGISEAASTARMWWSLIWGCPTWTA